MSSTSPWLPFNLPFVGSTHPAPPKFPRIEKPSHGAQRARIGPQFGQLRAALDAERLSITHLSESIDPELIVVFVLAEPVAEFRRAAEAAGIEYLAQVEGEDLPLGEGFSTSKGKSVRGYAHGIVTNSKVAAELIRCFNLWQKDASVTLPRGLAPLKEVFATLHEIRRWDASDRVRETGLLSAWRASVSLAGGSFSPKLVELELWYRKDAEARATAEQQIKSVVVAAQGRVISRWDFADIRYHGVLVELSAQDVEQALTRGAGAVQALLVDDVMFASSAEGMVSPMTGQLTERAFGTNAESSEEAPLVALLDGLPSQNHELLAGRLIIDDPESLGEDYPVASRRHGTAMASLLVWGDLNNTACQPSPERIYVRPIMKKHEWRDVEVVSPDRLLVDAVHSAFVRMFHPDQPAASSVRIVNLSIGCPERVFVRTMSPLGRLLDWLSFKYNVLIVVSAGNHNDLEISLDDQSGIVEAPELQEQALRSVLKTSRALGLLSPAESVNALTVGALHADLAQPPESDLVLDLGLPRGPAYYSGQGYGFNRSAKPDLLVDGGRQFYLRPGLDSGVARPTDSGPDGPGQLVAMSASDRSTGHAFGTSNAAALASRSAATIMRTLASADPPLVDPQYHPIATRALLAHSAQWEPVGSSLMKIAGLSRKEASKMVGYGGMDLAGITETVPSRAVVIGAGTICTDERHEFELPMPPSLHALGEWRRLKFTLAWFSGLGPTSSWHVEARLALDFPNKLHPWGNRVGVVDDLTSGGTLIQYVIEGKKAMAVQSGDSWNVAVEGRSATPRKMAPVRFALIASIEVADTLLVDVHEEVRSGLIQARGQLSANARVGV